MSLGCFSPSPRTDERPINADGHSARGPKRPGYDLDSGQQQALNCETHSQKACKARDVDSEGGVQCQLGICPDLGHSGFENQASEARA